MAVSTAYKLLLATVLCGVGSTVTGRGLHTNFPTRKGTHEQTDEPLKCPDNHLIDPCTCSERDQWVICYGSDQSPVTQQTINNVFGTLRQVNNASSAKILKLTAAHIEYTDLKVLDLTPMFEFQFRYITISNNPFLRKLFSPEMTVGRIDTYQVDISRNGFTDEDLKDTFKYFSSNVQEINLNGNQIQGSHINLTDGSGDIEIIHGLTAFPNLKALYLNYNKISKVFGGQFKRITRLDALGLEGNGLIEIGEDAFLINHSNNVSDLWKRVSLRDNLLTDERIHPNHGLDSLKNGWNVNLDENLFEYISATKFHKYLKTNENNDLSFSFFYYPTNTNQFICDQRMKWLKEAAVIDPTLVRRVYEIFCANDLGQTVFTTDLI